MNADLQSIHNTDDMFVQYKKHLGSTRYTVLKAGQQLVVPTQIKELLGFPKYSWLGPVVPLYKFSRLLHLDGLIKHLLLPAAYKAQIKALNQPEEKR